MSHLGTYLEELDVYPQAYQIDEASNYAQDKVNEYLEKFGGYADVYNGEVYVNNIENAEEREIDINAQAIFDESFSEKIEELQSND